MVRKLAALWVLMVVVTPAIQTAYAPKINGEKTLWCETENPLELSSWGSGMSYSAEALTAPGERCAGVTSYDHQQNGSQGNRVVPYKDTCVHVCWTYSIDTSGSHDHKDRAVYWNVWSNTAQIFFSKIGVKASGVLRAGYTTMGVLPDGKALVAFHERQSELSTDDHYSVLAIEAGAGYRVFMSAEKVSLNRSLGDFPVWPHIVVGSDGVIHIVSCNHDSLNPGVSYSRSIDQGGSFTEWFGLCKYEGSDVGLAVSDDGKKIAVSWVEKVEENFNLIGHVLYMESTDGGLTWQEPLSITADIYPSSFPMDDALFQAWAYLGTPDAVYDMNNNLHIVFQEAFWNHGTDDKYWLNTHFFSRIVHWSQATDEFSIASGRFGTYDAIFVDEETGEPYLDTTLYDMAWWGADGGSNGALNNNEYRIGCWKPQIAVWEDNIVVAFCGNRNRKDLSVAGTTNSEIYVTVSDDGGRTWKPIKDFDYEGNRHWWQAHRGCLNNVTWTATPEARKGYCADEDNLSIWPKVSSDGILHMTYIKDLFSGPAIPISKEYPTAGYYTTNPVMYLPLKLGVGSVSGTFNPDGTHYPVVGIVEDPIHTDIHPIELSGSNIISNSVSFNVSVPGEIGYVKLFDASGALVKTLHEGRFFECQTLTWDGTDTNGNKVAQGVYFYSFVTPEYRKNGRLILVR
ncbi:hypothetical protein JXM67_00590 [candidate division WOR-3 bacterium]|nr:hypothetical protein [candidate division WOR-3 bacterium]